jgi:hypothetical protein
MTELLCNLLWTTGAGGWVRFDHPELAGPLYVRFVEQKGGRWSPAEIYLDGRPDQHDDLRDAEVTATMLQLVARWLSGMSHMVNRDEELRASFRHPFEHGVDLSRLASHFGMGVRTGGAHESWISDSRLAQNGELPQPKYGDLDLNYEGVAALGEEPPAPDPSGGITNDFLRSVERYYSWQRAHGHRDGAARMAKASGVGVRTVHSWLYRGRQWGIIGAVRQGEH